MFLIWQLGQENNLLGIGIWETELIQYALKQAPKLVNWEYTLEHEHILKDRYTKKNIGFEKAVSPVITQYFKPINKIPIDKTGIFELKTFTDLVNFLSFAFSDASSLSNFYITSNSNLLVSKLQENDKPNFTTLLNDEDLFFGLLIGEDPRQFDYLLLTSKVDLTQKLAPIINKINGFAKDYVLDISTVTTVKEMIELIERKAKEYGLQ